jgi:hypothetical protein
VIVEPPVAPAVNGTDTVVAFVTVTVPIVGTCGTVVAVMLDDEADARPVATALDGVTVKVYVVADCSPVTVMGEVPVPVNEPGVDVAVNVVAVPPVTAAVYATVAEPLL